MINAYWRSLRFAIQEGSPGRWKRVIDTALTSPNDIVDPGQELPVTTPDYVVQGRSVVILLSDGESLD